MSLIEDVGAEIIDAAISSAFDFATERLAEALGRHSGDVSAAMLDVRTAYFAARTLEMTDRREEIADNRAAVDAELEKLKGG